MKIFFDSEAFVDSVFNKKTSIALLPADVFSTLKKKHPDFSFWISSYTINKIDQLFSEPFQKEIKSELFKIIQNFFSVIPLSKTDFVRALQSGDFDLENSIFSQCAKRFNADLIITNSTDKFNGLNIKSFSLEQFIRGLETNEIKKNIQVPFIDLNAQHGAVFNDIHDRFMDIIADTGFILGKHVNEFEKKFARLHGVDYCVGVSSGTAALHLALMLLGVGPGDRIIVPVNTFIATAEAVCLCGAEPVFVDCDQRYNIDINKIRELLSSREKQLSKNSKQHQFAGIIPVHLYGQPANMDEIMSIADEFDLFVVEDCCQAHLAKYKNQPVGKFGECGVFSFYPGKNLGAYGEAGAIVTNSESLCQRALMYRNHGESQKYHHQNIGHNYRMAALQGAVLSEKLNYLTTWTQKRRANAKLYNNLLKNIKGVQIPTELKNTYCVYHLYVIEIDNRDKLQSYLQEKGIATGIHYPIPLHRQPAFSQLEYQKGMFPMAEKTANRILSLPMYPELTNEQIQYVTEMVKQFFT